MKSKKARKWEIRMLLSKDKQKAKEGQLLQQKRKQKQKKT